MRLKMLELNGYKTFATRTRFEFGDRITAIVGPNGSGKSNIADALRWVLGEQAYSRLRAKKTEDMIFSGSEGRSRAGMAVAEVVFDNADGWLALDYTEVAITRRAYRDGQNDYLLNNQRVRLKDINELLSRAGLSEQGYTIVGQGLVDRILSLKPEELRVLFEDAAGIGLYRDRREESLRRLENTRRNLDRVEDILAELKPRQRSLERQARRWLEYEQLQGDLTALLREWYGYQWAHAQRQLTAAREVARAQEAEAEKARAGHQELSGRMNLLRDEIHRLRARLNAWHRELSSLHNRWETLNRELAVAEERRRAYIENQARLDGEIARLEAERQLGSEQLAAAQAEAEGGSAAAQEARAQYEAALAALRTRQSERAAAQKEQDQTRQALERLKDRKLQTEAQLAELQNRLEQDQESLGGLEALLHAALAATETAALEMERAEAAWAAADAETQEAQAELECHRAHMDAHAAALRELRQAREQAQNQAARIKAQVEVLDQADQALTGYAEGAKILLAAARERRLGRTETPPVAFSSLLEVPEPYEVAVAAVLGDGVDTVLLSGTADLAPALDLLMNAKTRGTILPLDLAAPPGEPTSLDDPDCIGALATLVHAPAAYRPALDVLLSRTWLVRDRAAALRLLPGQPDGVRLVTLEGEIFSADGTVTGGGAYASRPTLSRPRQRRELTQASARIEAELASLDDQIAVQSAEQDRLGGQGAGLERSLSARRQGLEAARLARSRAQEALLSAQKQGVFQRSQFEKMGQNVSAAQNRRGALESALAELSQSAEEVHQTLRHQSAAVSALDVEEYQDALRHWETRRAVSARSAEEAQRRYQDRRTILQTSERRLAQQVAQARELGEGHARLRDQQAQHTTDKAALDEELGRYQALIQPVEEELKEKEAAQQLLEGQEAEAGRLAGAAERNHTQAQIALIRAQESLETLRGKIEDDLGLVAFEYQAEVAGPTPLPFAEIVEHLPAVDFVAPDTEEAIRRLRAQVRRMGPVNPEAGREFEEVQGRSQFLTEQVSDLAAAEASVKEIIAELDLLMERNFRASFDEIAGEFKLVFSRLFGGGAAQLVLVNENNLAEAGVEIEARLPGRRLQELALLSGGERSLTATALIFALIKIARTPFCVLDEVDAMLDEANVNRFAELLREMSENTQFVVITHNRNTVQVADVIYGVTMGRDSTSQVLSLKLDEVEERLKS